MLKIALTGGIASGKSTAAAEFRRLGVPVIDMDQVARDVVEPGTVGLAALEEMFGADILQPGGSLDRARLRQKIFQDAAARAQVNALLHPAITAATAKQLENLATPYAIIEIPLLAETGVAEHFDRVLVVDLPEALQRERLAERDQQSPPEMSAILAAQAGRKQRLAVATDVIDNSGNVEQLRHQVRALHEQFLALSKRFASNTDRPAK